MYSALATSFRNVPAGAERSGDSVQRDIARRQARDSWSPWPAPTWIRLTSGDLRGLGISASRAAGGDAVRERACDACAG